jgi:hypothetical protein
MSSLNERQRRYEALKFHVRRSMNLADSSPQSAALAFCWEELRKRAEPGQQQREQQQQLPAVTLADLPLDLLPSCAPSPCQFFGRVSNADVLERRWDDSGRAYRRWRRSPLDIDVGDAYELELLSLAPSAAWDLMWDARALTLPLSQRTPVQRVLAMRRTSDVCFLFKSLEISSGKDLGRLREQMHNIKVQSRTRTGDMFQGIEAMKPRLDEQNEKGRNQTEKKRTARASAGAAEPEPSSKPARKRQRTSSSAAPPAGVAIAVDGVAVAPSVVPLPPVGGPAVASVQINRAPVLTLWAACVAEARQIGDWDTALTIGKVMCALFAGFKARGGGGGGGGWGRRGAAQQQPALPTGSDHAIDFMGHYVFMSTGPPLCAVDGKTGVISAGTVHNYLTRAFGAANLPAVLAAMREVTASFVGHEDALEQQAFKLYENFRPATAQGQKGELKLANIRAQART